MTLEMFSRVVLKMDIPKHRLQKGDVATIVEYLPAKEGEDGYALEVFNAVGETIAVVMVRHSAVEPLSADHVLSARPVGKTV